MRTQPTMTKRKDDRAGLAPDREKKSAPANAGTAFGETELLRVTLSSIGDGVIATDRHGKVTFLNPVAQSLTGWTQTQAVGHDLEEVFRIVNEDSRAKVENPALRALKEGLTVGLANHTLLLAKDGTERPIDDSAAPIRTEAGDIVGVVLVFRDVSERRRAEKAQRDSEALANALRVAESSGEAQGQDALLGVAAQAIE